MIPRILWAAPLIVLGLTLALSQPSKAQKSKKKRDSSKVFQTVEDMPEYPGGERALMEYIASIDYPKEAQNNRIEGTVYVEFIIDKGGDVTHVEPARGTGTMLDSVAVAHIKGMNDWEPGYQKGDPVKVQYVVPIRFRLTDSDSDKKEK